MMTAAVVVVVVVVVVVTMKAKVKYSQSCLLLKAVTINCLQDLKELRVKGQPHASYQTEVSVQIG